jgi:integrase
MKFTEDRIAKLDGPTSGAKDRLYFDDGQPGLAVRVSAKGARTYLVQYTIRGVRRRMPLPASTLATARSAAAAILGDVAKGVDPFDVRKQAMVDDKRKAARDAFTLELLLDQWGALHLAGKRERYAVEAVRALRHAFGKELSSPAAAMDRERVVRILDSLSKAGKTAMANRTAAYGRACYHWAVKRGTLTSNPFVDLPLPRVDARDRVLENDELRAIWLATAKPSTFNNVVRMLVLTGQRLEEVAGMAWSELSADLTYWTIPAARAKNAQDSIVPLSPQAQSILRNAGRYEGYELVFPGKYSTFSGWSKAKAALDRASGCTDWRLHDIRRSVATGMQSLGVRLEVTEAILNHVSGSRAGIVGVYQRHDWKAEKRAALNAWGERVAAIVDGRAMADNVTPFLAKTA